MMRSEAAGSRIAPLSVTSTRMSSGSAMHHLITQWMLGEVMRLTASLRAQGTPLQVSVT